MRRSHVRKPRKQVLVRTNLVLRYLSIAQKREEEIYHVVGERPAILWVDCWARGVIVEDVRQQGSSNPRRFRRSIAPSVFQRVREDGDETRIASRFRGEIGGVLLAG